MKILVIFTGGTIGSAKSGGWVAPDEKTKYILIDSYKNADEKGVEFVARSPYTILSEQLSGKELSLLCGAVAEGICGGFDGIIVAHGTDTLQYSAAAVALALGGDSIPVVFVSSGYPLEDSRANGKINFEAAVEFIRAKGGKGVFVSYANSLGGEVDIHHAARCLRHPELSDKVFSLGEPYARYEKGVVSLCEGYAAPKMGEPLGKVEFCENPGILTVAVNPADGYNYCLDGIKAVVLLPYHSGTLNTASNRFVDFCRRAKEKGIPVFLPDIPTGAAYESMKAYENLSIVALPTCTSVALTVKLWAGISKGADLVDFVKKQ